MAVERSKHDTLIFFFGFQQERNCERGSFPSWPRHLGHLSDIKRNSVVCWAERGEGVKVSNQIYTYTYQTTTSSKNGGNTPTSGSWFSSSCGCLGLYSVVHFLHLVLCKWGEPLIREHPYQKWGSKHLCEATEFKAAWKHGIGAKSWLHLACQQTPLAWMPRKT